MAAKAVKSEVTPQDQDLLIAGDEAVTAVEATEPEAPVEEPAAEKDSGEQVDPEVPVVESSRKLLNRDEAFGEIIGASNGACYVQDEIYFDAEGKELL